MPITITGTVFYADCECPYCGHEFQVEDEGTELVNEMYELNEVMCPSCHKYFDKYEEAEEEDDEEDCQEEDYWEEDDE